MFGMSVNEVPGWLVAMAPSAIGVPVAAWPGLVPHADVSVAAPVPGVADVVDVAVGVVVVPVVLLVLLLQPAAVRAMAAASMIVIRVLRVLRVLRAWPASIRLFISPPQGGKFSADQILCLF